MIGMIGRKMGMTQLFEENGKIIPVTVIEMSPNVVIRRKTSEKDGYNAYVLGAGKKKRANRPYSGIFKESKMEPTQLLKEIRDPSLDWKVGDQVTVSIFSQTEKVDITGYSKGRGFTGVMKRYGWHGGPAAHGSKFHRRPGAIGTSKTPGHVLKGHGLPGRMGNERVTVRNLKVVKVDVDKNLLFVKGAVPGPKNGWVMVKSK